MCKPRWTLPTSNIMTTTVGNNSHNSIGSRNLDKTNKNRRGGDKQHPNTVPNQTSESTREHPKMCTIERNGTNESNACGTSKKTRILYGTPQQRRKQARGKNENTSRKEGNVI